MKADDTLPPVLLYDGVCGFCNWTVQTLLRCDPSGRLRFAALQSEYGRTIVSRHPNLEGVDSVVLIEPSNDGERVSVRSTAALRLVGYLGGAWRLLLVLYLIPVPIRDAGYDLFARYRYRLFGRLDTCAIPTPEVRARFLDAS